MTAPGFAAELRATLDLAAPALAAATAALWRPEELRERYLAYLGAMYGLVRASVPLMERAAWRCERSPDPAAGLIGAYLGRHCAEERGHDDWLLADLAAAGGDPVRVAGTLPPTGVATMAGAQYYWIEHHHPVALLGYVAVLEGHAPGPELARWLEERTALPAAAFRTVRDHAALDTGHQADLDHLLDTLPLGPGHRTAVRVSALHTSRELAGLFRELAGRTPAARTAPIGGPP